MGVHEGRGQLNKAMKELTNRWLEARGQWQDVQAENLEKTYLIPLEADMKNAVGAMVHMAILFDQFGGGVGEKGQCRNWLFKQCRRRTGIFSVGRARLGSGLP